MKKIIFTILIALMLMIILFSGCVNKENEQSLVYDQTLLELRENTDSYDFYSTKSAEGFEFLLEGDVEEAIIQNEGLLTITKKQGTSTYLAIAGMGEAIKSGERLFSMPKEKVIFQQSKAVNSSEAYNDMNREATATRLLGDFNADDIVDIFDFVEFVQHCPSQEGEEAYGEQYDIGPATDTNADGIYDTKDADGFVDIFDFVVLARNYGKTLEPQTQHTLTLEASPSVGGNVSINGTTWAESTSTSVEEGTILNLYAQPTNGYVFMGWYNSSVLISNNTPIQYLLEDDATLVAMFETEKEPVIDYFEGPVGTVTTDEFNFTFNASDEDGYIDYYQYYKDGFEATTTATVVTWSGYGEGLHYFEVIAVDNDGLESEATGCSFYYEPNDDGRKYRALLVGVSEYDSHSHTSLPYHSKDVEKLNTALEYLDEKYEIEVLTGYLTENGFKNALNSYSTGSDDDVFLLYYGGMMGNGGEAIYLSNGDFYYLNEFKEDMDNIPGEKIIIMDGGDNNNFSDLANDPDYYVLASDGGYSYPHLESYIFTYFLCDGLGDVGYDEYEKTFDGSYDADGYNGAFKDKQITLKELHEYVYDKVTDKVSQYPELAPENSDFVIGTISDKLPVMEKTEGPINTVYTNSTTFEWDTQCHTGSVVDHYLLKLNDGLWSDKGNQNLYHWTSIPEGRNTLSVIAVDSEGRKSLPLTWEFSYINISGAFKVVNSWGAGITDWENVPDGFLYITEDAMKNSVKKCYLYEPPSGYEPKAVAVFELSGSDRSSCDITIRNNSNNKSLNTFLYSGSDNYPFPDNKIVLDITEMLPITGDLTLEVKNSSGQTVTIEYFAVEKYYSYPDSLSTLYDAGSSVPKAISSGNTGSVTISSLNISASNPRENSLLYSLSEAMTWEELEDYQNQGVERETITSRGIHGTGLVKPTEEELQKIFEEGLMRKLDPEKVLQILGSSRSTTIDHSQSVYFPPVGSQGEKGSCVAFSMGYYISSFYNAMLNQWDLSESVWENGYSGHPDSGHQEYISSPDFLYNQACGSGSGMSYQDAIRILTKIGISSWYHMPYDDTSAQSWPSEAAWREAPLRRSEQYEGVFELDISTTNGIEALKALLSNGFMVSISINSNKYDVLTSDDIWNTSNYPYQSSTDHANTVVGYIE